MPNFIAIEFEGSRLLVASAKTAGRTFQVNHLFEIKIDESETEQQIGESLKRGLADHGIARPDAIGLVGRQDAEVREMSVPPAPDDEMPDLVRFQARNVFASLNDNWLFDFVPFEQSREGQQKVLAVAIPPQIKNRLEKISDAAGVKLKRIVFRPFALCDLFEGMLVGDDDRLLILPVNGRYDLILTSGDRLLAARSFTVSEELDLEAAAKHAVGEVRRTIASTRSALDGREVQQVIVGGKKENWKSFESELTEALGLPIVFFAPLGCIDPARFTVSAMPDDAECFAGTVGALVKECQRSSPVVDFLNPRRPIVKKRNYRKVLIPVAALILIALTAAFGGWYLINEKAKLVEAKKKALEQEKKLNTDTDRLLAEVNALDKWQAGKVNWMDELAFVSEKLLTPDDIIISKFRGVETSKGFQMSLTSHVSLEQEGDNSWQESFGDRYKAPVFDDIKQVDAPTVKDHPVLRPFKLEQDINVGTTVDEVNKIASETMKKTLNAADSSLEADVQEEQQEAATPESVKQG